MNFSIMFFPMGNPKGETSYDLLFAAARLADEGCFQAVWMPERHFQAFGAPFPNPALTAAAIAMSTRRVQIRAGSVVAPLHHVLRVAEQWSVLDHLSHGRIGLSLASGWHAEDFVLAPGRYEDRREITTACVEQLRRLWSGGQIQFSDRAGNVVNARAQLKPLRSEVPLWLTAAETAATFERAGTLGTNILTALTNQGIETLTKNIAHYRDARSASSHGGVGVVTVMLHTYVGETTLEARETVRPCLTGYLGSFVGGAARSREELQRLTQHQKRAMAAFAFERFFGSNLALLGDMDQCSETVETLRRAGVDELACLVDFGLDAGRVLEGMRRLRQIARDA